MLTNIIRNFVVWVDGEGKLGTGEQAQLPALSMVTEDYRGGGMDLPLEVELGMEKLEASFVLNNFDPQIFKLFGIAPGTVKPFTIRGHLAGEDGKTVGVEAHIDGRIKSITSDAWQPGQKTTVTVALSVHFYSLKVGDTDLVEIDVMNARRVVNGVDQLNETRINLGIQ